jgi:hypothetical protein
MSDTSNEEQLFAQQIQIRTTGIQQVPLFRSDNLKRMFFKANTEDALNIYQLPLCYTMYLPRTSLKIKTMFATRCVWCSIV